MFKKSLFLLFLTILFLSFTQAASESHYITVSEIERDDLGEYVSIQELVNGPENSEQYVTVCNKLREGKSCNIGRAIIEIKEIMNDARASSVKISTGNEGTIFDVVYEKGTGNYITLKAQEDLPLENASFVVRKPNGSPIEKFTFGWENEEVVLIESERYRPDEHGFKFKPINLYEDNIRYGTIMLNLVTENVDIREERADWLMLIGGFNLDNSSRFYYPGARRDHQMAVSHDDMLHYTKYHGAGYERIHDYAIVSWKGPIDQHTACVNKQCVIVEGVGENECRIDRDCKLSKGSTPGTPGIMFSPPAEGAECNWFQKIFFKSMC